MNIINIFCLVNPKTPSIEENLKSLFVKAVEIKHCEMNGLQDGIKDFPNFDGCNKIYSYSNVNRTIFNLNLCDKSKNQENISSSNFILNNHPENNNMP